MKTAAHNPRATTAFTLLEVMIACGIFFMAVFTILGLVSATLKNARSLRRVDVDAGMVAAQLFKTNRFSEGTESGDFGDFLHDYAWTTQIFEVETNGLWQADIVVTRRGSSTPVDTMSVWMFSPESSAGPIRGGPRR
jgi:hypothetical protein